MRSRRRCHCDSSTHIDCEAGSGGVGCLSRSPQVSCRDWAVFGCSSCASLLHSNIGTVRFVYSFFFLTRDLVPPTQSELFLTIVAFEIREIRLRFESGC